MPLLLGQHRRWASERAFYAWAQRYLNGYFPTLPDRSQFLRQARRYYLSRIAAKCALHNLLIYLNLQRGRPPLAFADVFPF